MGLCWACEAPSRSDRLADASNSSLKAVPRCYRTEISTSASLMAEACITAEMDGGCRDSAAVNTG